MRRYSKLAKNARISATDFTLLRFCHFSDKDLSNTSEQGDVSQGLL